MSWRDIPGNPVAFERLRDLLIGGNAIALVGAGASAGLYPLWAELIQRLGDEAVNRGRSSNADRATWLRILADYPDGVVRSIKTSLGDGLYTEILREIFRPRVGPKGDHFTELHALLLRLNFKGYITTNFDAGLLEARLKIRPDSRATGYGTWKDRDTLYKWETGEVFQEQPCPVLFAHGVYDRSDTVVLGTAEYREAYREGLFRRLFLNLWAQSTLVFVGFSFADPWVEFVANEVLLSGGDRRTGAPRHVALLGLRASEPYSAVMRSLFVDQYNAEPLFYTIEQHADGSEDHGSLQTILQELGSSSVAAAPPPTIAVQPSAWTTISNSPVIPPTLIPQGWCHQSTEDSASPAAGTPCTSWKDGLPIRRSV